MQWAVLARGYFGEISSVDDVVALPLPKQAALAAALAGLVWLTFVLANVITNVAAWTRRWWVLRKIPAPAGGNFLLGNVLQMLSGVPWDLTALWAKQAGGLARFRVLDKQCVTTDSPEALKRMFQSRFENYGKDLGWTYNEFIQILGTGLVTAGGQLWRDQRRRMSPVFKEDILQRIVDIAFDSTERLAKKLDPIAKEGGTLDIEQEFRLLTLQVIGKAAMNLPPEECDRVFPELYLPVMEENNRRVLRPWRSWNPFLPDFWLHRSRMAELNRYLIAHIKRRWAALQKNPTPPDEEWDILTHLLATMMKKGERLDSAAITQTCYELKTFLLAGHETSAAMLTWSTYELAAAPELRERVAAEAREHIPGALLSGAAPASPNKNDVDNMAYGLGVLKESLRKYSVVPVVTRLVLEDDEVLGHVIPKGTYVMCVVQGVHHHHWPEPQRFKPERFLPGGEYDQFDEKIRDFMFVPFIAGPRNCLGQYLALLEARVVMGMLADRYVFSTTRKDAGERHPVTIPVGPKHGMEVKVEFANKGR
ncbi:unnamed protein product [Pedinophyceae sp. YPF-701]|nr:unnamed protein product [Pedinophyceae sp. YPF-701]